MKIIEALKELPLIEKRIMSNVQKIATYAAGVETGNSTGAAFDSVATQRKELASLIQANEDLVKQRALLRRRLYITNTTVEVEINGVKKTITEWIEYREKGFDLIERTYNALNELNAMNELRNTKVDPTVGAKVVKFYDEAHKNKLIEDNRAIRDQLDAKLEIINATTDLVQ